jgi:type IV secretion system protein VirD4
MTDTINDLMRDIPRGLSSRFLHQQSVPQARWQSPETIADRKALAYQPDDPGRKVLVGAYGDKLVGIEDNRHIMTVAGSRTGKSVTLIGNLLFYRGSVLATDPKGELANITAARRAALGQKVHILDPFEIVAERLAGFRAHYNPMSVLHPDSKTIIEDAGLIADALVIAAGKDPHWDESAKNFIEGIMLHVATAPEYDGARDLVTVRTELVRALLPADEPDDDGENAPLCALELAMLENAERLAQWEATADLGNALEGAARDFFEKEERERSSVHSTARRHTKFLDYSAMRRVLRGHDFNLADLKANSAGVSVYLCLPASRIGLCNRWLRIFVNQLLDAMEREKTKPAAPVLVCLDEFPVLGYMSQLEDAAGQIASFDVKLWVMLQDWGQGKALYKERWETFAGNSGILQFFGNNDLITTEYISRRLGKTRVDVTRSGEVGRDQVQQGMSGRSESAELHDMMTPEEISRFYARNDQHKRQLVIWAGYNPMILQRIEYFDPKSPVHHVFKGKYADASV